jgi:hypothetical protein
MYRRPTLFSCPAIGCQHVFERNDSFEFATIGAINDWEHG